MRFLDPEPIPIRHLPPVGQGLYVGLVVVVDAWRLRLLEAVGRR